MRYEDVMKKVYECAEHRRYQAKRPPRVLCETCWELWIVLKQHRAQAAFRYTVTTMNEIPKSRRKLSPVNITIPQPKRKSVKYYGVYRTGAEAIKEEKPKRERKKRGGFTRPTAPAKLKPAFFRF